MNNSVMFSRTKNLITYVLTNYTELLRNSDNYDVTMTRIVNQHITACEVLFSLGLNADEIIDTSRGLNYHRDIIKTRVIKAI